MLLAHLRLLVQLLYLLRHAKQLVHLLQTEAIVSGIKNQTKMPMQKLNVPNMKNMPCISSVLRLDGLLRYETTSSSFPWSLNTQNFLLGLIVISSTSAT